MEKKAAMRIQDFQKLYDHQEFRNQVDQSAVTLRNKKRVNQQNQNRKLSLLINYLKNSPDGLLMRFPELSAFRTIEEVVDRLIQISCDAADDKTVVDVLKFMIFHAKFLFWTCEEVSVSPLNASGLLMNLSTRSEAVIKETVLFIANLVLNSKSFLFSFDLAQLVWKILPLLQTGNLDIVHYVLNILADLVFSVNLWTKSNNSEKLLVKILPSLNQVFQSLKLGTNQNKLTILRFYRYLNFFFVDDEHAGGIRTNLTALLENPDLDAKNTVIQTVMVMIRYSNWDKNELVEVIPHAFVLFESQLLAKVLTSLNFFQYLTYDRHQNYTQMLLNKGLLSAMMNIFESSEPRVKKSIALVVENILAGTESQALTVFKFSFNIIETFLSHARGFLFAEGVNCIYNTVLQRSSLLTEKVLSLSLIPQMFFYMSLTNLSTSLPNLKNILIIMKELQKQLSSSDWANLVQSLSEPERVEQLENLIIHSKVPEITHFLEVLATIIDPAAEPQPIMQKVFHFSL